MKKTWADLFRTRGAATNVRWIVLAMVAFASASAYLTRYCISAANTTIQSDLELNDAQMGKLMGAFALGYLFCQIPGGWLGNRFGTRFAFAFISVCWSLSSLWSAIASGFHLLYMSRFSLGIFQAGLTPVSAKILKDWIPNRLRGISSALITASMSIGGAFTLWLTGRLLASEYSWRAIFAGYSVVGIVWAYGFHWYFRTFPRDHQGVNDAEHDLIREADQAETLEAEDRQLYAIAPEFGVSETSSDRLALKMLMSPGMWGLCIQSFFRAAGYAFFVTWFFAFLEYRYNIGKAEAGLLNSLPLIAVVLGCMSGGVIVDMLFRVTGNKWISRCGTAIATMTVSGLVTMASAWTSSASQLSIVIAVGAFFSGIGAPAAWVATIDIGGKHTAVVMGTMNMAGCIAGAILPVLLGNWFNQIRVTGGNWDLVIYLHAAFYFIAAMTWFLVNPKRQLS